MKKRKVIHFNIPMEDEDIIRWKDALPSRTFNRYVNEILLAESKGEIAHIPRDHSSEKEIVPVNGRLIITDQTVIAFVEKMKKGHITEEIKQIIRKQVFTYSGINLAAESVRAVYIADILKDFRTKIFDKEKEFIDVPDKYRKLCESYELAIKSLFKAILDCCDSDSEAMADSRLLHFDSEKIINDSFNAVFGTP